MTLQQFQEETRGYRREDVSRVMVTVLANGAPRTPEEYRDFYLTVSAGLQVERGSQALRERSVA